MFTKFQTAETEVEIESKAYTGLNVTKSEPIAIPHSASVLQVVAPLVEEGNSVKVQCLHRMKTSFSAESVYNKL